MSINELKSMNERERITYFATAKTKDLKTILKSESVKGYYKLRKAQALEMVLDMILEPEILEPEIVEPEIVEPEIVAEPITEDYIIENNIKDYLENNDFTPEELACIDYEDNEYIDCNVINRIFEIEKQKYHEHKIYLNDFISVETKDFRPTFNINNRFVSVSPIMVKINSEGWDDSIEEISDYLDIPVKELKELWKGTYKIKFTTLKKLINGYNIGLKDIFVKTIDIKIMNRDILDKTNKYIDLDKIYNITKDYTKDHYRLDSFIDIVDNSYEITGYSKHYKAKGFNDCYFEPKKKLVINMSERFNNLLPEVTLEGLSKRLNISTKELEDLCKPTTKIKIETLERLLKMYTIYDIITQK